VPFRNQVFISIRAVNKVRRITCDVHSNKKNVFREERRNKHGDQAQIFGKTDVKYGGGINHMLLERRVKR
jgi:hypothetical protein